MSLTTEARYAEAMKGALKELKRIARPTVYRNRAVVAVVGDGMGLHPGIAGQVFSVLGAEHINIELISQGASELNLTFVVKDADAERAVKALHAKFLEGRRSEDPDN